MSWNHGAVAAVNFQNVYPEQLFMVNKADAECNETMTYALRLLSRREFFQVEMNDRLHSRGYSKTCVRQTVDRLVQLDCLNEDRYAHSYFRVHLRRGETPWLVAAKAKRQGVQEAAVDIAFADCLESYDAVEACREELTRRDPQKVHLENRHIWQRHARYLKNKGFDTATIILVMNAGKGD